MLSFQFCESRFCRHSDSQSTGGTECAQNVHVCRLLNSSKSYVCVQRANVLLIMRISHKHSTTRRSRGRAQRERNAAAQLSAKGDNDECGGHGACAVLWPEGERGVDGWRRRCVASRKEKSQGERNELERGGDLEVERDRNAHGLAKEAVLVLEYEGGRRQSMR
jgi:hypothetical protein